MLCAVAVPGATPPCAALTQILGILMPRPDLKTTFNTVASLYDEVRPGYPDELVRDVLDFSGIDKSGKILEVGCGTGQASRLFAAHGCEMTCLDIGRDLIEVAKVRLNHYKNVRFTLCPFEDWDSACKFDLVISATAFPLGESRSQIH